MGSGFRASLHAAANDPSCVDRIIAGVLSGQRHLRRWRNVFEGKATSSDSPLRIETRSRPGTDSDADPD